MYALWTSLRHSTISIGQIYITNFSKGVLRVNLINPLFLQKKIGLFLTHLVPEILGLKVALLFHQNVLFNSF